jgi:hypothetical protein
VKRSLGVAPERPPGVVHVEEERLGLGRGQCGAVRRRGWGSAHVAHFGGDVGRLIARMEEIGCASVQRGAGPARRAAARRG